MKAVVNLSLVVSVAFMVLVALAQWQNYSRVRIILRYFANQKMKGVVLCRDAASADFWKKHIDGIKYPATEVINIMDAQTVHGNVSVDIWEWAVRRACIMKYPCLLTVCENEISGEYFEVTPPLS